MKFVSLEVQPVARESLRSDEHYIVEHDADADYFALYGRDEDGLYHAIGDFSDRRSAESIKAAIENG